MQKVVEIIQHNENTFDLRTVPQKLTNIVSGQVATAEVERSLTGALDTGMQKQTNSITPILFLGCQGSS